MRKLVIALVFLSVAFLTIRGNLKILSSNELSGTQQESGQDQYKEINGTIKKGETLFDIFKRYSLDLGDLFKLREASAAVHKLKELYPDRPYKIILDQNDRINAFVYWINDDTILNITQKGENYSAEKIPVNYEKRTLHLGGIIKDNLISSMGESRENLLLALQLSDVFAWDIDFNTDLRNEDEFKIVVEGLYLDGEFRKFGNILSAEFMNNGEAYRAYRYELDGSADFYDHEGKSLRKAFLKAPLSFRRISSSFSRGRYHPILKIYRPHHGLDYAAPAGTPVSAAGNGTVLFAGYKGQYGKMVILRHNNGYKTYYGHLSRIGKGIKNGSRVDQGMVIGYVGSTGLSTGPHLHYEMRLNNKPLNPLKLKIPRGTAIPERLMADFRQVRSEMETQLSSILPGKIQFTGKDIRKPAVQKEG